MDRILSNDYIANILNYVNTGNCQKDDKFRRDTADCIGLTNKDNVKLFSGITLQAFSLLSEKYRPVNVIMNMTDYKYYINTDEMRELFEKYIEKLFISNHSIFDNNGEYNEKLLQIIGNISNLRSLILRGACDFDLRILPDTLSFLLMDERCFSKDMDYFPRNLKTLVVNCNENIRISNLPNKLDKLILTDRYNQPLPKLPQSLKSLSLGENFNHPLIKLPSNLESLKIGNRFNSQLKLPNSIITFHLRSEYAYQIDFSVLDNIQSIILFSNTNNGNYVFNHSIKSLFVDCEEILNYSIIPRT